MNRLPFTPRVRGAILLAVIVLATFALWDTFITWPVRLLVVFVHEGGHALMAVLTGGHVREFVIRPNLSGHVVNTGGVEFLVASAGYLTSVAFGGLLMILSARRRLVRPGMLGVGIGVAALALVFGWRPLGLALPFGLLVGGALIALAVKGPDLAVRAMLFYLAACSSLYAVVDIRTDLFHLHRDFPTDASILASQTFIPALVWATLWAGIAAVILFFSGRYALRKWS